MTSVWRSTPTAERGLAHTTALGRWPTREVVIGDMADVRDMRRAMLDVQRAYFVAPLTNNSLDHAMRWRRRRHGSSTWLQSVSGWRALGMRPSSRAGPGSSID